MALTSSKPLRSDPVRLPEKIGPVTVKAGLASDQIGPRADQVGPTLGEVTLGAVVAFYGTVKEAAFVLGGGEGQRALDPSLMSREIKECDFRRIQKHGSQALFDAIADAQKVAFGSQESPLVEAMRICYEVRTRLDRLEAIVKAVA